MLIRATEEFLENAEWLRDVQFSPLVSMLKVLAAEIDSNPTSSMLAEYGRAYRYANSLRPEAGPVLDPLENLLKRDAYA